MLRLPFRLQTAQENLFLPFRIKEKCEGEKCLLSVYTLGK